MTEGMPWERIKRQILIRTKSRSNKDHGKKPSERSIQELLESGIINLNKPSGPSSHQVSSYVQKILNIKKSGHSGTLDPRVTGVLPVALGSGTRIVQALLVAGKEYICLMRLHKDAEEKDIRDVCKQFTGKIKQLPPIKSAVKRRWRYRKIYYLDILEIQGRFVLYKVGCQAGTYIRKLCTDIGDKLGTGAHMAQLVRSKAGPFTDKKMVTLQDLRDAFWYFNEKQDEKFLRKCILPIEEATNHLPKVWIRDTTIDSLSHGMDLKTPGIAKVQTEVQVDEMMAVLSLKGELVALGTAKMISKDMETKEKGLAVKINKVFMKPGTYPRSKKKEE